jgi:ATP-dependent protease HslVU (ClpYQ) peptidase subunit
MGAVHALRESGSDFDAATLARAGVEAALSHDLYCGGPVNLETVRLRAAPRG